MESENQRRLQSALGDSQVQAVVAQAPPSLAIRRALARVLRKRVKKFIALAPEVFADPDPEAIHDVRVWSRRLQQAVGAFFPKPRRGKVRRLRRTPRRIRRALGEWRNCDVLLEIVGRRQRRTRSEAKRQAWAFVRDYLLKKRSKEVARARKKMLRQDLGNYPALAHRLLDQSPDESPEILMQRLHNSVQRAWTKWLSAMSRARESRAVNDLHALRVATKALRYRTELLYDVGHKQMKPQLKWLADLQEAVGLWHDRQLLHQAVAEAVAGAEVLLNELPTARLLLAELETERRRDSEDIENIFRFAIEHPGRKQMESWSANRLTPYVRGET